MVGIHPPIPVIPKVHCSRESFVLFHINFFNLNSLLLPTFHNTTQPMEGRVRDGQRGDTEERVPLSVREGFPLQAMPSARTTSSMALSDSPTHAPHSPDKPSIPSLTLPTSPEQRSNPLFYAASGGGVSMLSAGTYTTSSTARSDEGGGTGTGTFPTEQKTHPGTIASGMFHPPPYRADFFSYIFHKNN